MKVNSVWFVSHYSMPPEYEMRIKTQMYAHYLGLKGIDCTIFSASTIHNTDINLIEGNEPYIERVYGDLKFVHIRCDQYQGNGFSRIRNMHQFTRGFSKVAKSYPLPDIVVADVNCVNYAPIYNFCKRRGIPVYVDIRDLWPESIIEYLHFSSHNLIIKYLYYRERTMYRIVDGVIFSMEGWQQYLREKKWEDINTNKFYYINNGVDLKLFDYNRDHFQIDDIDLKNTDSFKVVYTGSIRRVNNLGLLLDTAKHIVDKRVVFLIWGEGDERKALEDRVREEGISNVKFKGWVDKKYIPYIVSQADLNLAHNTPSRLFRYGISFNKIFDYMAAGKPILCDFPSSYNPVIQCNAGRDISETTSENIAKAIEEMVQLTPEQYSEIGLNARKAAEQKFDYENLSTVLLKILET